MYSFNTFDTSTEYDGTGDDVCSFPYSFISISIDHFLKATLQGRSYELQIQSR